MPRHQEELFRLFERRVYGERFKHLSGWDGVSLPASARDFALTLTAKDLGRYNYENELLNPTTQEALDRVNALLQHDYGHPLSVSSILLAPSLTSAITTVLHWLRSRGINNVIADPPYYFSYLNIAERLGMRFLTVPRTIDNRNELRPLLRLLDSVPTPRAVVICDPRYVLGTNYTAADLQTIGQELRAHDVLIVDHAMDTLRCSVLSAPRHCQTVRLFSFGKTVAMNGARMAAVVAPDAVSEIRTVAGAIFGSHDFAALKLFTALIGDPPYLSAQRSAVSQLVRANFRVYAAAYARFRELQFQAPANGILGYILLDLRRIGRFALYGQLMERGVHAMFGQHFGVASSGSVDLLRINYLLDCRAGLDEVAAAVST
jgi:aspartate/methionine/tyrosine aminotransferase